jgi:exodeoxyribonuclease V gamma subunit
MSECGDIKIYYSASVDRLADALNDDIMSYLQTRQNPLKPLNIIVPNGHIQKYLNRRLTKINGVVANMEFPFLESGLYQALNDTHHNKLPSLLTVQDIELALLGFFCDVDNQDNPDLSPLYDYLLSQQNQVLISQKRWQLTEQLALLFIDYELSRPDMVAAWLAGRLYFTHSQNNRLKKIEAAQRAVYLTLFKETEQGVTLNGLLQSIELEKVPESQPIYLFVPSRLSPLHRHIILLLAQSYPVHIYHFNVCREFWQDLETDAEISWRQSIQQLNLTATDANGLAINNPDQQSSEELFFDLDAGLDDFENPLLKAWGKPGRETLRLLSDLENDAIHAEVGYQDDLLDEHSEEIDTPTCTLQALQHSILNRIPGDESQHDLTTTVQLAAAPSIEVEVSQVYNSILYELKQDPALQLNDIAVLVTDMSSYRYVIEQVFDRLNRHVVSPLRYSISDSNAGEESLYARAVSQLLMIIETDFIRDEVFAFLANPCVMAALDSHLDEIDAWLQTAVDLGIYRGFHQLYASPNSETRHLYTWEQGLQRLHRSLAQSNADRSSLNSHEIGRLSVIMTRLNSYKTTLNQQRNGRQWQHTLQNLFDTFMAVPADYQQEESVALNLSRDLQQLADQQPDLKLGYHDIKHYLLSRLTDMDAGRGRYLSGGVVCAALQPMRPVPFKLTYVLGLGESKFPGQIRHNTLDLAAYSRRIGDINQVENNKYLFLETVMSCQQKLFLSYIARDEKTGDSLAPSVVVNDVIDWFEQDNNKHLPIIDLPLSPAENFKLQTRLTNPSLVQNHSISDYLLYRHQITADNTWSEEDLLTMTAEQRAVIDRFAAQYDNDHSGQSIQQEVTSDLLIDLTLSELNAYLINPTETIFVQQGGVLNRIEDTELLSDEPLRINPLDKHQILNQAVATDLKLNPDQADINSDLASILDHQYHHYLQQSRVPIQLFASIEPLKDVQDNEDYQSLKSDIESNQLLPLQGNLVIGSAYSQASVTQQLPAVRLGEIKGQPCQLSASIAHLMKNNQQQMAAQVIIRAGKYDKDKSYELLVKAFLDWCLLLLHDEVTVAENHQVWLIFQDKVITQSFRRDLIDQKIITNYLKQLCRNFIDANNDYLPLALHKVLSFKYTKKDQDQPIKVYPFKSQIYFAYQDLPGHLLDSLRYNYRQAVDSADKVKTAFGGKKSPSYNEIKSLLCYPPAEDVLVDYQNRFMLFFSLIDEIDIRSVR